MGRSLQYSL